MQILDVHNVPVLPVRPCCACYNIWSRKYSSAQTRICRTMSRKKKIKLLIMH